MTETLFEMPAARTAKVGSESVLLPLLKWPGGKSGELDRILAAAPDDFDRYFEPFVGGGAVYWAVDTSVPAFVNDISTDLMDLYGYCEQADDELFRYLDGLDGWWDALAMFTEDHVGPIVDEFQNRRDLDPSPLKQLLSDTVESLLAEAAETVTKPWSDLAIDFESNVLKLVPRKIARMRKVEHKRDQLLPDEDVWSNIEGAYKACAYTSLRSAYNIGRLAGERSPRQTALFFYLREYAYAAMFRFNSSGEFNVPYGGISYNRKDFAGKIDHLRSHAVQARLTNTTFGCEDFETFLDAHQPGRHDYMFLDPPYDSDFSSYDENDFTRRDHARLADVMRSLDCKVQLVIKATPAVLELYSDDRWNILAFDKKYMWTIKERNNRDATHLMITNYVVADAMSGTVGDNSNNGNRTT